MVSKIDLSELEEPIQALLEDYRQRYEAGDLAILLQAVSVCFQNNQKPPGWVRDSFLEALATRWKDDIKSWDAVFGRPNPKGTRTGSFAYERNIFEALLEVKAARDIEKSTGASPEPLTNIFRSIGAKKGVSWETIRSWYYEDLRSPVVYRYPERFGVSREQLLVLRTK
jgi:hypothetical protein